MTRPEIGVIWAALVGALAVCLMLAPFAGPLASWTGPHWLLCVIAFWRLRAPAAMPALLVFTLGLGLELLRDGPLGLETAALLISAAGLARWRAAGPPRSLVAQIAAAAVAALAFEAIIWLALAATFAAPPELDAIASRWVLTVAAFGGLAAATAGLRGGAPASARSPRSGAQGAAGDLQ